MRWDRLTEEAELVARRRPADDLLQAILEASADQMKSTPSLEIGRLLEILAGERGIRRVLEVGTGLGFSTVCLARGARQAEVVSVDSDDLRFERVRGFLERAGVAERVRLLSGEPTALVDGLEARLDLVHLAMAPEVSRRMVDRLLPRLEVGGMVTVEHMEPQRPRDDREAGSGSSEDEASARARSVAGYLVMHPQLDCTVLPIGDGLAVARKKRPTVTEMGGPF